MIVASCASNDEHVAPPPVEDLDAAPIVMESDADASDGGCDEDAAPCVATPEISCDDVEWCLEKTDHPKGIGLVSVWGSGPNDVWAVGALGNVIHWDGKAWASAPVPSHWSLRAVWGTGPNDVWTVSAPNQIFHTTGFANGTAQWSPVAEVTDLSSEPPALACAIWGTAPGDMWFGGSSIPVQRPDNFYYESGWRSAVVDGGAGWEPVVQDYWIDTIRGIWGSGPGDIWIVGSKPDKLPFGAHTDGVAAADGGVPVWTEVDTQSISGLYAVWGSGPGDVWSVGDYGTIRHSTAGAGLWSIVDSPTSENLRGIWGAGAKDIWAVGEHGTVLHYDGVTWRTATTAFPPGDKPHLYGVWGSGPTDVWAVGSGVVLHFTGPKPDAQGSAP
jgi:hypothetical protein